MDIPEPPNENSPQDVVRSDARFNIDRDTFSLIIDSVEANDAGDDYRCFLSVFNPRSSNTINLDTDVALTLMVNGNYTVDNYYPCIIL